MLLVADIYIYNAEFTAAVMLLQEIVEIEGNEFWQSKNLFICRLNWDLCTNTGTVCLLCHTFNAAIIPLD